MSINRTIIGKGSVSGDYANGEHMLLTNDFSLRLLQRHTPLLEELSSHPTITNTAEIEAQLAWLRPHDAVYLALLGCEAFRIPNIKYNANQPHDYRRELRPRGLCQRRSDGPSGLRALFVSTAGASIRGNQPWMRGLLELLHKVRCEQKRSNRTA
ncbi:hypothetical protein AK830_g3803 [Neonectria ditissima]|uniref:Uncharacterized protein n=1 Tax=Neonectria ditissima TaxID=78410 RepID=A0A0P7BPP6_9HYPO|nr:hypothetical protein AK830_g3803 [Neonectria ditissima]